MVEGLIKLTLAYTAYDPGKDLELLILLPVLKHLVYQICATMQSFCSVRDQSYGFKLAQQALSQ